MAKKHIKYCVWCARQTKHIKITGETIQCTMCGVHKAD